MTTPTPAIKPAATRLYIITGMDNAPVALVEAANPSQAGRHYLEKRFKVAYAEQKDLIAATKAGIEPETASADPS